MGKIVLHKDELNNNLSKVQNNTENAIFNDLLIKYNELLSQFDDSKGSTADKIRKQLKKEKELLNDLGELLEAITVFMKDACAALNEADEAIANKIELN